MLKGVDEYFVGWAKMFLSVPVLLLFLFSFDFPQVSAQFYVTLAKLLPLDIIAYCLMMKAFKASPLSLTVPFLAVTPAFSVLVAYMMLGETASVLGIVGVLSVVIGAYVLNADAAKRKGLMEPLKRAFTEKGSRFMLIVAFIFSFTSTLGKKAILQSSVSFFTGIYFTIFALALAPLAINRVLHMSSGKRKALKRFLADRNNLLIFLAMGLVFGLAVVFHCLGIAGANVAYAISIKRSSIIFSVLYGGILFKEANIHIRLAGAGLMFAGMILVGLA